MIEEFDEFYTKTMAESYVQQGYLSEALEIYQHLIEQSPDEQELLKAVSKIEITLARQSKAEALQSKDLTPLMCKWFDLMLAVKQLKKIKTLKLLA